VSHIHKGTKPEGDQLREVVTLLKTTGPELENILDETEKATWERLLAGARAGDGQIVIVAAVVLSRPGKPDRLVHYAQDHGDDEGEAIDMMEYFVEYCQRQGLLEPEETMHIEVRLADWDQMSRVRLEGE
jgi:hypothetical protein